MSEEPESGHAPGLSHVAARDAHEYTVEQVRDVTSGGKIILERSGKGVDTAFRQLFPTTYDLAIDHPEGEETSEDR